MRAPEQESIDAGALQRRQQSFGQESDLLTIYLVAFDELNEPRAGRRSERDLGTSGVDGRIVGTRGDSADRADDTDFAVVCHARERPGAGFDHADDRHRQRVDERAECSRGGGVARDDNGLHAVVAHEAVGDFDCVVAHLAGGLVAIRIPTGVADVDERLIGHQVDE